MKVSIMKQYQEDYFVYSTGVGLQTSFPPMVGGSQEEAIILIEADSYFKAIKLNYFVYITTGATTEAEAPFVTNNGQLLPPITVDIIDDGSGRILTNEEVFVDSLFGVRGGLSLILPTPRIFRPRSSIRLRATYRRAAGDGDPLQLICNFIGVKGYQA
jgi:hypothetical protein